MSETPETEMTETPDDAVATNLALAADLSCFTEEEIARLVAARARHDDGKLNEDPTVYGRLRFVRWLHEQEQSLGGMP